MTYRAAGCGVAAAADKVDTQHVNHNGYLAKLARPTLGVSALDHRLVWMIVGSVMGAMLSGAIAGRLRPRIYRGAGVPIWLRLVAAFVGGAFMGYGSQWGRGCTSGQALSGGVRSCHSAVGP